MDIDKLITEAFDEHRTKTGGAFTFRQLCEVVEQTIEEQEADLDLEALTTAVVEAVKAGVAELGFGEFDESMVQTSGNHIRLNVPTSGGRAELAEYIRKVLESQEGYDVAPVRSRGQVIGYSLKKDRRRVALFDMKPMRGAGVRNKGDVAEGILGAAVAASFINGDEKISTASAEALLEELNAQADFSTSDKQTAKVLTKKIKREDGTVDEISLDIRLAKVNFDDLMDSKKRSELSSLFQSAVGYANSDEVLTASQAIMVDNNPTKIRVLSDGVGDQKGTKVDVRIFMDEQEMDIGRISLKAGATKQLGQIGKTWEAMAGDKGMFKVMFGVQPDPALEQKWVEVTTNPELRTTDNIKNVAFEVYSDAHNKIKSLLAGDVVDEEMEFIQRLASGVRYQAVLEEKGVRLIQLSKGDFKVLDFSKLEEVLTDVDFDVTLQKESSKGGISPKIIIYDKKSGGQLISMRVKIEGGGKTIRHYIEKEDFLVKLINVAKKSSEEA